MKRKNNVDINDMIQDLPIVVNIINGNLVQINLDEGIEQSKLLLDEFIILTEFISALVESPYYPSLTYNNRILKEKEIEEFKTIDETEADYLSAISNMSIQFIDRDDINSRKKNWEYDLRYFFMRHEYGWYLFR